MSLGAMSGVHAEQPSQPLDRLPALCIERTSPVLAHPVHGVVQRFHEIEAVDDGRDIGAALRDRLALGAAHVATGPANARFLPCVQTVVAEPIDGVAAASWADPQDARAGHVVDESGKFAALAAGSLKVYPGSEFDTFCQGQEESSQPRTLTTLLSTICPCPSCQSPG